MLGRYLGRTLEGWDHFFFFPFVGKNGFLSKTQMSLGSKSGCRNANE